MAKDPAFLFYPSDWISGTLGMTFEEKGAYFELLMTQFNQGHMTSHMIGRMVGQLWSSIENKFVKDENGLYYNIRLEEEKQKRKAFTESRRNNIKGINQHTEKKTKKVGHKKGHMTSHMENVNENEIIDYFKEKGYSKESAKKFFDFYSVSDWKDSNGKKVINWKQKAQSVWFTDENKIKPETIKYKSVAEQIEEMRNYGEKK
jgi:uncharacterized protein YdaU (DUF1376 family)